MQHNKQGADKTENFSQTKVPVRTSFDKEIYIRIRQAKKKMGLSSESDIIRVALAFFLDKNGY